MYESVLKMKSTSRDPLIVADIYDGRLYREFSMCTPQTTNTLSLSVVLNTDGVVVFKSTNYSIWPMLLMVNELPFSERLTV